MSLEKIINGIKKVKQSLKTLAYSAVIGAASLGVLAGGGREAKATLVNSNSIIRDNIEYYMQTDKSVYDLRLRGENVEMLYRVSNLGEEDVTFRFGQSPVWNFWVEKNGENVFTAVKGWYDVWTDFTLSPNTSKEFPTINSPYVWNMNNNKDNLVKVGEYNAVGGLFSPTGYYDYTEVSVPINIIPEPSTFGLLGLGASLLALSKRKHRLYK